MSKNLEQAKTMISKAKAQLVINHPFYASLLLRRPMAITESVPTLAINAKAQIFVNPDFAIKLTIPQLVWALAHECSHVMFLHFARLGHRNPRKANIAQDAVINDILTSANVGDAIPGCVNMPGSKGKTWEQVYDELPDDPPGDSGLGEDVQYGNGSDDGDADSKPMTQAEISAIEAAVKVEIAQAAQAARMQGKMPAGMERLIEDVLEVKTPWYDILERFMTNCATSDYSWAHPNRRFIANGTYLPSMHSEAAMGEMVIAVDTSGSVGNRELAEFAGHINRIMETCKPELVHVVYCDARINKTVTFTGDDLPIKLEAVGGGGTAFEPVFEWVSEQDIKPACLVYLTDGYGSYPKEPDYPTLWAMVTDYTAPWGECVYVEADAN